MQVRPQDPGVDHLGRLEQVVVVVPVGSEQDEAQQVAQEGRDQRTQALDGDRGRRPQLQDHDRDDDGDDAVAERLEPALAHGLAEAPPGDGEGVGVGVGIGVSVGVAAGVGVGVGGGATPSRAAMSCWMRGHLARRQDGRVPGRNDPQLLDRRVRRLREEVAERGSASRGRSVQANPFAASKRAGALRIVAGPICLRMARSSVCWRAMRP